MELDQFDPIDFTFFEFTHHKTIRKTKGRNIIDDHICHNLNIIKYLNRNSAFASPTIHSQFLIISFLDLNEFFQNETLELPFGIKKTPLGHPSFFQA